MKFSERANAISPFLAMAYGEKAAEMEKAGKAIIRFNLGEPDFGAPTDVIEAMKDIVTTGNLPYTSALGLKTLRQAISGFYKEKHRVDIPYNRIVVTAGASAALLLVSAALVNEGDNVVIGDPSYPCNRRFISSFGGEVSLVPTPASQQFQLTKKDLAAAWQSNTKGVVIASPANPTGTSISGDEMKLIRDFCNQHNAWRVVDEIYLDIQLNNDHRRQTVLAIDDDAIVINSFSKYFGMTGWRLGWCVVPEVMVDVMEKLAQNLYICPSTPAQHAALACFTDASLMECEARRQTMIVRKNKVLDALKDSSLDVEVAPDGAFYVYINIAKTGLTAIEFCDQLLEQQGVAMTPGNDFGEHNADHYVRLSFATDDTSLEKGLEKLIQFADPMSK